MPHERRTCAGSGLLAGKDHGALVVKPIKHKNKTFETTTTYPLGLKFAFNITIETAGLSRPSGLEHAIHSHMCLLGFVALKHCVVQLKKHGVTAFTLGQFADCRDAREAQNFQGEGSASHGCSSLVTLPVRRRSLGGCFLLARDPSPSGFWSLEVPFFLPVRHHQRQTGDGSRRRRPLIGSRWSTTRSASSASTCTSTTSRLLLFGERRRVAWKGFVTPLFSKASWST